MDTQDTYKTIKKISYGLYREKGSKFIALASLYLMNLKQKE
jgi:hypothetical protein